MDIRELARLGADARIKELQAEIAEIQREFGGRRQNARKGRPAGATGTRKRRVRKMSAAARAALSKRMKAYWANRRKAKTGTK